MTVSMLIDASTALDFSRGGLPVCLGLAVLALPALLVSIDVFVVLLALPRLSAELGANNIQQFWEGNGSGSVQ